jgi:general secretion pathway protein G
MQRFVEKKGEFLTMTIKRNRRRASGGGFTLVELLIVLMILAMLFAILIPNFLGARFRAQLSACEENESSVAKGLEVYFAQNQSYPTTLDANFCNQYVGKIPTCPLSMGNYTYTLNAAAQSYTIICTAPHHQVDAMVADGYPQFNHNAGGLLLQPSP